jgi:peptide/nickel transport system substrate-binding protein
VILIDFMVGPDPLLLEPLDRRSRQFGAKHDTIQQSRSRQAVGAGRGHGRCREPKVAYQKMQELTRHDLPYLPIFQYAMVQGVKGKLQGFAPNVNVQENCWNANTWYWAT